LTAQTAICSATQCIHKDQPTSDGLGIELPKEFGKYFDLKCLLKDVIKDDITVESIGDCLKPEPDAKVDVQCVYECFKDNEFKLTAQTAICSATQCIHKDQPTSAALTSELALPAIGEKEIFDRACIIRLAIKGDFTTESISKCINEDTDFSINPKCVLNCIDDNGNRLNIHAATCSLKCVEEVSIDKEIESLPEEFKNLFDVKCLIKDVIREDFTIDSIASCLKDDPDLPVDPKCVYECIKSTDDHFTPQTALCSLKCINKKEPVAIMTSRKMLRN